MLGGGAGGVGGGEDGVAEGAAELDGLGEAGVGAVDEEGLEVGPVPGPLPLDGLASDGHQPFVTLVHRPSRYVFCNYPTSR